MHFYTPAMLHYWIKDITSNYRQGYPLPDCRLGIHILETANTPLHSEYIYIAEASVISTAIRTCRSSEEGFLFISSGKLEDAFTDDLPPFISLIETKLPLLALYNRVQAHTQAYLDWNAQMQNLLYTNGGLQKILDCASAMLHADMILVNSGYKYMAAVYHPDIHDPTVDDLQSNGYLSYSNIQAIHQEIPIRTDAAGNFISYISKISNNYTWIHLIRYQNDLVARLCIILDGPHPNRCYEDFGEILAEYVTEYLFSHHSIDYSHNAAFGSLVSDLIEYRLTDSTELEDRLQQLRLSLRKYYHLMIISFDHLQEQHTIPWNFVISQLRYVFPYSNITTYRGDVLLLIQKRKNGRFCSFDHDKLLHILEHYNGHACISNTGQFLTSLPTIYYQTRDGLRLGQVMHPEQRILYYEDYGMYQIIELAAETYMQHFGIRNLIHLCNSEMVALLKYDKKHGTNLTEILHSYLVHDRNMTETAKNLFIHRNTLLNKIHKIEKIIGSSLDNPNLRNRLIFSHYVLEYMTLYRKEDLLVLKKAPSKFS